MRKVNIVLQRGCSCQGKHAEAEYTYMPSTGQWHPSDAKGSMPVVGKVEREDDEMPEVFSARISQEVDEIDRQLGCSRCYR